MKTLKTLFFYSFCCLSSFTISHAVDINTYLNRGAPSPDRVWLSRDYAKVYEMIAKGQLPLPILDPATRPLSILFERLVNVENLSYHHNKTIPFDNRFADLINLGQSYKSILLIYIHAANKGERIDSELSNLISFQLALASSMLSLVYEYIPTIPKDNSYKNKIAGLDQVKKGMVTILNGAVVSLSERHFYSTESVITIATGIKKYYPSFDPILPESYKTELKYNLGKMLQNEKNVTIRQKLSAIKDLIKVKQKPGAGEQ